LEERKMRKKIFLIMLMVIPLLGCDKTTEPKLEEEEQQMNNQMSFNYNGVRDTISILAEENGYVENEVVFRGGGKGLVNTIMLTFKLINSGTTKINDTMTGYWSLALCTPMNKYLLTHEASNYIQIISYDPYTHVVQGKFDLRFRYEKDTTKVVKFSQGNFRAKIDTSYAFYYCIEG
jgi:hypothetical protein